MQILYFYFFTCEEIKSNLNENLFEFFRRYIEKNLCFLFINFLKYIDRQLQRISSNKIIFYQRSLIVHVNCILNYKI